MSDIVERVARAMFEQDHGKTWNVQTIAQPGLRAAYRANARTAVAVTIEECEYEVKVWCHEHGYSGRGLIARFRALKEPPK